MQASTTLRFLIAAAAAAVAGCGKGDAPATQPAGAAEPVSLRAAPVERASIDETVEVVGTLFGEQEALVAAKSTGRIAQLFADLGDRLDQGQALAQIDPTDYQLEVQRRQLALAEALSKLGLDGPPGEAFDVNGVPTVRKADVQARNAGARLDRSRQLFEQKPPLISEQDFADTQTLYDVARQDLDVARLEANAALASVRSRSNELAEARQQLADATLRAPGDAGAGPKGRWAVAERRASIGAFVQPGTVTFRLISDRPILLRAQVPERYLAQVRAGQPVALRVDALPRPIVGTVARVSPAVDATSRTFNIEVAFANDDGALRAGSFGRATITVGRRDDVVTVPAAALYSFAGLDKVFSIKDGAAVAHTVRVVERSADRVILEDTLKGASPVALEGLSRLATGVPVTIREGPATTRVTR